MAAAGGVEEQVRKSARHAVSVVVQCTTRKGIRLLLGFLLKCCRGVDPIHQAGDIMCMNVILATRPCPFPNHDLTLLRLMLPRELHVS